ncbi:CoxG family protein [Natronoarchaeum sp. GCM10025703]|uniref:CoxG family protein n=1 Tax=unclassified Natronoarchaeum TaxID=2620183 RepID=UPI00361D829E
MEYDGTTTIPALRDAVWEPITDPEVLTACVMGAEEIERVSERRYEGVIRQSVAGITVSLAGEVQIETMVTPERLTFSAVGTDSRTNARMDADVEVVLSEAGEGETRMDYIVDVRFAGKLATLGSRILRRQIKANIETYFDNLAAYAGEDG